MNKIKMIFFCLASILMCGSIQANAPALKVAMVNFKNCVEKSKMGKKEQSTFESLKKQMETVLEDKEKAINEIGSKLNDADYMDSLSAEAENELKHKFRAMSQEVSQNQSQYYQALNQANYKIIQQLTQIVTKAASKVAKEEGFDLVLNEEGTFFYSSALDISDKVVKIMDELFENEQKSQQKETAALDGTPQAVAPAVTAPEAISSEVKEKEAA